MFRFAAILLAVGASLASVASASAREVEVTYTGQFVHVRLEGSLPNYTIERAPLGSDDFQPLETNLTGCTSACTFNDFTIDYGGAYLYQIGVLYPDGTRKTFGPTPIEISVEDGLDLRVQATPNPVLDHDTSIEFTVPATIAKTNEVSTRVQLLTPAGRIIYETEPRLLHVGEHSVTWDGRDQNGRKLPSGSYFYRVIVGGHADVGRLILLR